MKTTVEFHDGRVLAVAHVAPSVDVESLELGLVDHECMCVDLDHREAVPLAEVRRVVFEP